MTATRRLPLFEKFIRDLRMAWAELPDAESRMKRGAELLAGLVNDETLRQVAKSWPSTEGRKNLLRVERLEPARCSILRSCMPRAFLIGSGKAKIFTRAQERRRDRR